MIHVSLDLFIVPGALSCFIQENPTTLNGISDTLSAWCMPESWTALGGPLRLSSRVLPPTRAALKLTSYVQELKSELVGRKEGWGNKNPTREQTSVKRLCCGP